MWLTRKINSIIKQQQKSSATTTTFHSHHIQQQNHKRKQEHISFVLAVISTSNTKIVQNLGLEEIKYDIHHPPPHHTIGKLYRLKNNELFIIQLIEYKYNGISQPPHFNLDVLDGVFIFYDTISNKAGNLQDITNMFTSQHVPCLLIGLNNQSDLLTATTKDHLMAGIQVDTRSIHGIQLLQKHFIQFIYSDRKVLLLKQRQQQQSQQIQQQQYQQLPTINKSSISVVSHNKSEIVMMERKNSSNISHHSTAAPNVIMRRTSSCNTASTVKTAGETISDIVDQVLNNQNENSVIIFLTVYRKFMKPSDLVNILIKKFEESDYSSSDSNSNSETLPNPNSANAVLSSKQSRIQSFLYTWLSHYWGDFKSSATRRVLEDFVAEAYNDDVLLPLHRRDPIVDKDAYWAMCDELCDDDKDNFVEEVVIKQHEEDQQKQETTTTKQQKSNRKKDSGYCQSFGDYWINQQQQQQQQPKKKKSSSALLSPISNNSKEYSTVRRAASTNTHHQRIPPPSLSSFKSMLVVTSPPHYHSNKQQQDHYNNGCRRNSTTAITTPPTSNTSLSNCSAIFGGGMISFLILQQQKYINCYEIITSTPAYQVAEQLTWIDIEIFTKIQPRDFLRHLYTQKSRKRSSNSTEKNPVLASIEHFNFISGWIASLIVNQVILERRMIVFEYCLQIALELRNFNNFNTLMAVLAGLNSAAILRLKLTRESVKTKNKKLYNQFLDLELLMSSERSFCNYRQALKQTELPGIPYLGIHQQDLVSLGEANKDHKKDGRVHWKKFRLMGESILDMMRFQYPTGSKLEANHFLLNFIGHGVLPATEDERYEKSMEIEPKCMTLKPSLSTKSTSSSSTRWLSALHK